MNILEVRSYLRAELGWFYARLATASYRHRVIPLTTFRDAMGEDQFLSKVSLGVHLIHALNEVKLDAGLHSFRAVHYGSWFGAGQVAVTAALEFRPSLIGLAPVFVDLDAKANEVAMDLFPGARVCTQDMCEQMALVPDGTVITFVNSAMEHLSVEQANQWFQCTLEVAQKAKYAIWILQGTNMPAEDHLRSIDKSDDLLPYGAQEAGDFFVDGAQELSVKSGDKPAVRVTQTLVRQVHKNF